MKAEGMRGHVGPCEANLEMCRGAWGVTLTLRSVGGSYLMFSPMGTSFSHTLPRDEGELWASYGRDVGSEMWSGIWSEMWSEL